MTTLHYIFDPLCGWCYAAAPLIDAARKVAGLQVVFHGGGMMAGANRRAITPQWRDYVMPHDQRIAKLTGQPFGEAYFEGLLRDDTAVMDSAPPTTAILAVEALNGRGLEMAHQVQRAHYAEGRRIADIAVLTEVAQTLDLGAATFADTYTRLAGAATEQHFAASRKLLARAGGQGFPTLALEHADGMLERFDIGPWLGQPAAFASALRERMPTPEDNASATIPHCGLDGCRI